MSGDRVYLDHSATTPLDARVLEAMLPYLTEVHGNASSLHREGGAARDAIEDARDHVAALLGATPAQVHFTGGGTESDNLAVLGIARAREGAVVTSAVEHHAVLHAVEELARAGRTTVVLPVDADGRIDPDAVPLDDVALVSVMAANNETGTLQPIQALGDRCRAAGVPLHTDAVQLVGTQPFDFGRWPVDAASCSAHKLYGPKGVGLLLLADDVPLRPLMYGGSHEFGRRPGTENVAGIVGLTAALALCVETRAAEALRLAALRDRLRAGIAAIPDVTFNTPETGVLPHLLNASFAGVEGEALLLSLNAAGIAVATGSACTSSDLEPSHVLRAMGRPDQLAQGSLRFSLGRGTTDDDIARTLAALERAVANLRALSPLYEG